MKENNNVAKKVLKFLTSSKLVITLVMLAAVFCCGIRVFWPDFFGQRTYLIVMLFVFLGLATLFSLIEALKKRSRDLWGIFILWLLSLVLQILTFIF